MESNHTKNEFKRMVQENTREENLILKDKLTKEIIKERAQVGNGFYTNTEGRDNSGQVMRITKWKLAYINGWLENEK